MQKIIDELLKKIPSSWWGKQLLLPIEVINDTKITPGSFLSSGKNIAKWEYYLPNCPFSIEYCKEKGLI